MNSIRWLHHVWHLRCRIRYSRACRALNRSRDRWQTRKEQRTYCRNTMKKCRSFVGPVWVVLSCYWVPAGGLGPLWCLCGPSCGCSCDLCGLPVWLSGPPCAALPDPWAIVVGLGLLQGPSCAVLGCACSLRGRSWAAIRLVHLWGVLVGAWGFL